MPKYVITPDRNILIRAAYRDHSPLVEPLIRHIQANTGTGVITTRALNETHKSLFNKYGHREDISYIEERFDEITGFFDPVDVCRQDFSSYIRPVKGFFEDYVKKLHRQASKKGIVAYKTSGFKDVRDEVIDERARDFKAEKLFWGLPEDEDMEHVAEDVYLKQRKFQDKHVFLASLDTHISDPYVSKAIEKTFGVIPGKPPAVLSRISRL